MSNPDFSKSPQHVALAKVLAKADIEAWGMLPKEWEEQSKQDQGWYLFMADAAITHLGAGYVLPEATEENAERLARAAYELDAAAIYFDGSWDTVSDEIRDKHMVRTRRHLRALRAAFGDAEKPNPADYSDPNSPADPTYCRKGCDKPFGHPGQHSDEEIGPGWADKANRDDYRREVILALAANSFMMQQAMGTHAMRANSADWLVQWADVLVEAAWK